MSSFTNVKILEANRLSSTEAKSGNNTNTAQWTNKLGSGVKISVGDQITVQSSFIGERGAGDKVIELSGDQINASKTISFLNASEENTIDDYRFTTGCSVREYTNGSETIDLTDNKCDMVISYYKNANGENYVQMPRKFVCDSAQLASLTSQAHMWYFQEGSTQLGAGTTFGDSGGLPHHQIPYFFRTDTSLYYCDADYYVSTGFISQGGLAGAGPPPTYKYWKIRNDNHKYKIYVANTQYFNGSGASKISDKATLAPDTYHTIEPSMRKWSAFTKKITVDLNKGFNSPEGIAEELTNELKKTGQQQIIDYPFNLNSDAFKPSTAISTFLESQTYNTFDCFSYVDMQSDHFTMYNASNLHDAIPTQEVVDYINCTNLIGIKRPELWDAGTEMAYGLLKSNGTAFRSGSTEFFGTPSVFLEFDATDEYLTTNIPYTDHNIALIKNVFDKQALYPELFNNKFNAYGDESASNTPTTVLNSRFLHINQFVAGLLSNAMLGTDDISASGARSDHETWKKNYISLPFFFMFDNNASNTVGDGVSTAHYGVFYKYSVTHTLNYIRFKTGASGTNMYPPADYLKYNDGTGTGTKIDTGTCFGWDTHFTAYSTCVISMIDGWNRMGLNENFDLAFWKLGINPVAEAGTPAYANRGDVVPKIRKMYLGANDPLVAYDTNSQKFNIQQLHTCEYIGNQDWAGGGKVGGTDAYPANPDANEKVYKINKRNNGTNWTTALIPYSQKGIINSSGADEYQFDILNYNFTPYAIFDSQAGILIEDFGLDEKSWDDGLWGILGFSYNQFNSSITSSNDLTKRITNENVKLLPYGITNADVSAEQAINFRVNGWGVPMYNLQVPTTFWWNGSGQTEGTTKDGARFGINVENHPPITEIQKSIQLTATNLPRKMLKPYYCIRSDIIDETHYLGGADSGTDLPVVAVVNKINGYGDFYFAEQSELVFTATKERMLTSITTSIHYPDQTYAEVNKDSAVIYKITHQQPATANIVAEILAADKN